MNRSRTTWSLGLLWIASACTALQKDPAADSDGKDLGSLTRGLGAKELRKHYVLDGSVRDGSVRDARAGEPKPSSPRDARVDAPLDAAAPPPVVTADAAVDAASESAGAASQPLADAATMVEPPPDPPPDPPPPMCLPATAHCDDTAQCCGALQCGDTTLGRVCCGLQREPCSRANGEDCCGQLSCDWTSLGVVCCGERNAPCNTKNGEDCCRELDCVAGRCQ